MFIYNPHQADHIRFQFGYKVIGETFMIFGTGANLRDIRTCFWLLALQLYDEARDTWLIELTQFVILLRIDLTEITQIGFLTLAGTAIATASARACLPIGCDATIEGFLAIAACSRPAILADALPAMAFGTLGITIVALEAFTIFARIARITHTFTTIAFPVMRANLLGKQG